MTIHHAELKDILLNLLSIPSPTFGERNVMLFVSDWLSRHLPGCDITIHEDCLIARLKTTGNRPHMGFIGHSDTVPAFFEPFEKNGRIYGSGASDMKGALACFLYFLKQFRGALEAAMDVSFVLYSKEEGTPLEQNGLYDLIKVYESFFKSMDLAIVGEPTDNVIQLGSMGSLHCEVTVFGKACHSARPWNGENALYKALPVIEFFSKLEPVRRTVFGVDFYDVIQITESESEKGRTTLPGYWRCNINYRFSPVHSNDEAVAHLRSLLKGLGLHEDQIVIRDIAPVGKVIDTAFFRAVLESIGGPVQAKQAWTDVAQLTQLGVPAFNFGPGRTDQAHQKDEYIVVSDMINYLDYLERLVR